MGLRGAKGALTMALPAGAWETRSLKENDKDVVDCTHQMPVQA